MESLREQPTLRTGRLVLRPLVPGDAPQVRLLAGNPEIAATTLQIPHPYPEGAAERFIEAQGTMFEAGQGAAFAIVEKTGGVLCGCIGLGCDLEHSHAELGYWIGVPFWGRGYATEAARQVVAFGFAWLALHRICARHFASNPASGRVLEKIGMRCEGRLREHFFKPGRGFEDSLEYGLLIGDWNRMARETSPPSVPAG